MKICSICGKSSELISEFIGVCKECIINKPDEALPLILSKHNQVRRKFSQSPLSYEAKQGITCPFCGNNCTLKEGEIGLCGLIKNEENKIKRLAGSPKRGVLSYYYDPLPTNCVADWVCPAGTGAGYPKYTYSPKCEIGYYNLAVFYAACLPGDELIFSVIDGKVEIIPFSDLAKKVENNNTITRSGFQLIFPNIDVRVASFNPVNKQINLFQVNVVSKRIFSGRLCKFITEEGALFRVTDDHPMILLNSNKINVIPAGKVRVGDKLLGVKGLKNIVKNSMLTNVEETSIEALLKKRCNLGTFKVKEIIYEFFNGFVYDLQVPEASSFALSSGVITHNCNFNCLFCQNWHFRNTKTTISAENLANKVNEKVSCICFFGGDPTPQMPHALKTADLALKRATDEDRILRICWETNGGMHWNFAKKATELSLSSGGCVKFDLKCFDENLNIALCGVSNSNTLKNFEQIGARFNERPSPPLLVASTLLIPGYVDEEEVYKIAEFISSINPDIPYRLLAFHPEFYMNDLPTTSRKQAYNCLIAAKKAGCKRVDVGNIHLLK